MDWSDIPVWIGGGAGTWALVIGLRNRRDIKKQETAAYVDRVLTALRAADAVHGELYESRREVEDYQDRADRGRQYALRPALFGKNEKQWDAAWCALQVQGPSVAALKEAGANYANCVRVLSKQVNEALDLPPDHFGQVKIWEMDESCQGLDQSYDEFRRACIDFLDASGIELDKHDPVLARHTA